MKKIFYSTTFLIVMAMFSLELTSCKDDEPFVKPKLSFAQKTLTVNEADGTIEVELILDKAYSEDITISYKLDGDAFDDVRADVEDELADYEVIGEYEKVTIEKGETKGIIELRLLADFIIEDTESIEISITDTDSENIEITRDDDMEISLEQEQNGIIVELTWDETYTDVDMDLLLRVADIGQNVATQAVVWGSIRESFVPGESIFIPASIENVIYGFSYNYYSGTKDPMNFTATIAEAIDGIFEAEANWDVKNGTYTLANINEWTNASSTKVVQTIKNVNGDFIELSEITVPSSGSRVGDPSSIPKVLMKDDLSLIKNKRLNTILQNFKRK